MVPAFLLSLFSSSQEFFELHNAQVIPMNYLGESVSFRDFDRRQAFPDPVVRDAQGMLIEHEELENKGLHIPNNPNALPQGLDPVAQKQFGTRIVLGRDLDITIDGIGFTSVNPADPCSDVGPNHVVQMINGGSGSYVQIFDKSGNSLGTPVYMDNWLGTPGGAGDPIVLYDALADRWLLSEFGSSGNRLIVAISTTPDPTGTYHTYDFSTPNFPDYPKYSIWNDMYMVTSNEGAGCPIYALERPKMLIGDASATTQRFTTPDFPTIGFQATTPITFDNGTVPPAGAPAMLMRMADDAWSASIAADRLEMWTLSVDFATPSNSVLSGPTLLPTQPFDTELCGYTSFSCIDQPGGTNLDPLREVIMNRAQYRNMGTHEAIVCNHVTDVDGTDHAGVRWYELRRTGGVTQPWTIYQQGTYSPDSDSRWMAGISINAAGDIGLAYSVAGPTLGPSLRYTGRSATDPLGQMTFAETTIIAGTSGNGSNRWGDYFSLDSDPTTGSFWGTGCYNTSSSWSTRVFEFSFAPSSPDYSLDVTDPTGESCQPANAAWTIQVGQILGYTDPVTLSVTGLPAALSPSFNTNPVVPGSNSTLTVSGIGSVSPGVYTFDLNAASTTGSKSVPLELIVYAVPAQISLSTPPDGSTGVSPVTTLSWNPDPFFDFYEVDIATDPAFSNIVESGLGLTSSTYTVSIATQPTTTYYWRVRSVNPCFVGNYSSTWSYTTSTCESLTVQIVLDRYGAETTWRIEDATNTVYASGGPYTNAAASGEYPQPNVSVCLPAGCYSLLVDDSFGDGICCAYGNGEIAIIDVSTNTLASISSFGSSATAAFYAGAIACLDPSNVVEDFEAVDPCLSVWDNVSGDDFDWSLNSGGTASVGTGPSGDHTTGSGIYIYTETSNPVTGGDVALLESQCLDITGIGAIDVSFWFHMFGPNIGTLELQGLEGSTWNTFWTLSGDQGDIWTQAFVTVPTAGGLQKLRFRAEVSTVGNAYQNDFALDDIQLTASASEVQLSIDMFLEGPFNSGTGLMDDALRVAGLIPTTEPYTAAGYTFIGGGGESIVPSVLTVTGPDAIIDWVVVELRDAISNNVIVASRSALLQADGDVVDLDGVSNINIASAPDNYCVAVRHRNHLGVMVIPAIALSPTSTSIDFTTATTTVFGIESRKNVNGVQLLWAGDVSFDGVVKYIGTGNDRDQILQEIGGSVPTNTTTGYRTEDVNMNGIVKYTGSGNDRDPILINIGGAVPTNTRLEQLP
jgi:hypothetical protein